MQIITITTDSLHKNPFNTKNPMTADELALFKESLSRWGISRAPIVCDMPGMPGEYTTLDGNTLIDHIPLHSEIEVQYIPGIDTEDRLKQITLDFIGVYKRVNRTAEQKIAESIKTLLSDAQRARYAIDVQVEAAQRKAQEAVDDNFHKMIVLDFRDEEIYEKWRELCDKAKEGIRSSGKLDRTIESIDDGMIEKAMGAFVVYCKDLI